MAINLIVSSVVKFKVKGSTKNEAGKDEPFDFWLTCKRLTAEEIQAKLDRDSEATLIDFMLDLIQEWSGVKDEDGKQVPFSEEMYRHLANVYPGLAAIVFKTYADQAGAAAKN